uniref:Uncharacterized protein n=1 Tax=Anguilla anguilla TaxID=7936 RepID=A0A0E9Q6Y8_ANGAN
MTYNLSYKTAVPILKNHIVLEKSHQNDELVNKTLIESFYVMVKI